MSPSYVVRRMVIAVVLVFALWQVPLPSYATIGCCFKVEIEEDVFEKNCNVTCSFEGGAPVPCNVGTQTCIQDKPVFTQCADPEEPHCPEPEQLQTCDTIHSIVVHRYGCDFNCPSAPFGSVCNPTNPCQVCCDPYNTDVGMIVRCPEEAECCGEGG